MLPYIIRGTNIIMWKLELETKPDQNNVSTNYICKQLSVEYLLRSSTIQHKDLIE